MSEDYRKYTTEHYDNTVRDVAQTLRDTADDFEKRGLDHGGMHKVARTTAAGRAIHALQWGLANASVERIVSDAALADEANREEKRDG